MCLAGGARAQRHNYRPHSPPREIYRGSFVGRQSRLFVLGVLAFLFTTTAIIHNKYLRGNDIMNDFPDLGSVEKKRGAAVEDTRNREKV